MKACVGAMSVGAVVYYTWGAWTPQEARVSVQWHTIYGVHGPRMRQECGYSGILYMGCVDPARGKSVGAVLYYTWGAWTCNMNNDINGIKKFFFKPELTIQLLPSSSFCVVV